MIYVNIFAQYIVATYMNLSKYLFYLLDPKDKI